MLETGKDMTMRTEFHTRPEGWSMGSGHSGHVEQQREVGPLPPKASPWRCRGAKHGLRAGDWHDRICSEGDSVSESMTLPLSSRRRRRAGSSRRVGCWVRGAWRWPKVSASLAGRWPHCRGAQKGAWDHGHVGEPEGAGAATQREGRGRGRSTDNRILGAATFQGCVGEEGAGEEPPVCLVLGSVHI